jgi:hypothetical protein
MTLRLAFDTKPLFFALLVPAWPSWHLVEEPFLHKERVRAGRNRGHR